MSAPAGKSLSLMLPRPTWLAAAAFSLAVHGGVAAMFLRGEPAAPVAGSAVPVEVVIVEGPDVTVAAAPDADAAEAAPVDDEDPAAAAPRAVEADADDREAQAAPAPRAAKVDSEADARARNGADPEIAERTAPPADEPAPAAAKGAEAAAHAAANEPPQPRTAAADLPQLRPEPRPQPEADRAPDGQGHAKHPAQAAAVPSRGAAPLGGNPKPAYPRAARLRGEEGRVVLRVEVLASGEAGAVTIAASSGHPSLDRAARDALRQWRFQPAVSAGRPVRAVLDVPVRFRLDEGGPSW